MRRLLLKFVRSVYYPLYRLKLRLQFYIADHLRLASRPVENAAMPPAVLRFRVGETIDRRVFAAVGRNASDDIESALVRIGRPMASHRSVLDFGCGCGRVVAPLAKRYPNIGFSGTDVDTEAIEWSRAHLPAITFQTNGPLPPLSYADHEFDLVYCISVFTHLSSEHARQWLPELRRVLRPGGTLLVTVHGKQTWSSLPAERRSRVEREGHLFSVSSKLRGIVPDWYHTAYYSQSYVSELISEYFEVLAYSPCGLGYQDIVVAAPRLDEQVRSASSKLLHGPTTR